MRNREVIESFVYRHNECKTKTVRYSGNQLYHYATVLAEYSDIGLIVNITKYSRSTSNVQNVLLDFVVNQKYTTVEDILGGTNDLRKYVSEAN